MRLIFAGTPQFAACALEALIASKHQLVLVLTQPDRPAGRGMKLTPSAVKRLAEAHRIELFQPVTLKHPDAQAKLREANADGMIVAAYGLILPEGVLDIPTRGCINIHASLLPRWRGAAPIQRAILGGDRETGITIIQMDAGLDTGPILLQEKLPITPNDTAQSLHDRLAIVGAKLIISALESLERGTLEPMPQPQVGVTYANKVDKAEALIDWHEPAELIERKIRAFIDYPVAYTAFHGQILKLWHARLGPDMEGDPGTIVAVEEGGISVACGKGTLVIDECQRAAGKRLAMSEFLRGCPISLGERLGA